MNFLNRLFGLIFNKSRSTTATEHPEVGQVEGSGVEPEPEPEPDVTVFAAPVSQSYTQTTAPPVAPAPPLDTVAADLHSAAVESVAPAEKDQHEAPSADAMTPEEETAPGLSVESVSIDPADSPDTDTAEQAAPVVKAAPAASTGKTKLSETPEIDHKTATPPTEELEPVDRPQASATRQKETAPADKHDIDAMIRCCEMELTKKRSAKDVPAPLVFERVAILSRKEKNYPQEIDYCERYIKMTEAFYKKHGTDGLTDVRKGAKHRAIVERLPKARALLEKQQN